LAIGWQRGVAVERDADGSQSATGGGMRPMAVKVADERTADTE